MKRKSIIFGLLLMVMLLSMGVQVSAKTNAKTYKITYVLNKGTNNKNNVEKYKSNTAVKLYTPSRKGYTFKGWYTDKKLSKRITKIKKGSKKNVKLYAKWSAKTYSITYNMNGGINNKLNMATYNCTVAVKLLNPTKKNYVFEGWYTDSDMTKKVSKIGKGTIGNITLYAKWKLETININKMGNADMIWSWWYYPQVVSYQGTENNIYWGMTTSEGYCGVAAYNYETKTTTKTYLKKVSSVDDHNGLAVTVMRDGKVMCVYSGGHNSDNEIHVRISDSAESIKSFSTDIVLYSSGKTCYSQILEYNNKYYIFYRVDNKNWAFRSSEDGLVWTNETILVTSLVQYYCKFVPTTEEGVIRICMISNPTSSDPNIRMGFFNLNTEELYNADNRTVLGKDNVSRKSFDIIIKKPSNLTQRMLDVAVTTPENPMILYDIFSTEKEDRDCIYKIYDAGVVTEICHGGNPLWNPKYQLGACFLGNDKIVVAREENGYDNIELYHYDNGNISLQDCVYSEEAGSIQIRNARPIADINGKAFLWHRGFYDSDSYTNFYTEAKLYTYNN
jgi:uncharacterized repeat protein (TIGR02543 family)